MGLLCDMIYTALSWHQQMTNTLLSRHLHAHIILSSGPLPAFNILRWNNIRGKFSCLGSLKLFLLEYKVGAFFRVLVLRSKSSKETFM